MLSTVTQEQYATTPTLNVADVEALLLSTTNSSQQLMSAMMKLSRVPAAHTRFQNLQRFDMGELSQELAQGRNQFGDFQPDPETPCTDIATISTALRAADVQTVAWTNLADLPAMWLDSIRALANDIFPAFGLKSNTSVKVICSFADGTFLNTPLEVNSVLGFLENNFAQAGQQSLVLDFSAYVDNYTPEARVYYSDKHTYLVIKESEGQGVEGHYIYCFERDAQKKITA